MFRESLLLLDKLSFNNQVKESEKTALSTVLEPVLAPWMLVKEVRYFGELYSL